MRWVICTLLVLAFTPRALADDFDTLRGSQPVGPATFTRWSGFYFGGNIGFSDANANFSNATQNPIAFLLRETVVENEFTPSQWPVLGKATQGGTSFGAFAGYNTQWQDLVIGLETNYERASLHLVAPATPISRVTPDNADAVTISANGTLDTIDYATLRARAGWVLGNVLPYGFVGVALGQTNVAISTNVQLTQNPPANGPCSSAATPPCAIFNFNSNSARNGAITYGFVAGGGVDVALTPNLFLRGELEYVQFTPVEGVIAGIVSARVGAGIKF